MQAFPCPLLNVLVISTAVVCLKAMCGTASKELCLVVLALLYDHRGIVPVCETGVSASSEMVRNTFSGSAF